MVRARFAERPYFRARRESAGTIVDGARSCELGHALGTSSSSPDGVFARWHWDGSRLVVDNDRYGAFPLYYFVSTDEIIVSPSIPQLLAAGAPAELDYNALSVLLWFGQFVGEQTAFRSIRIVPPNAVFRWENGELEIRARSFEARHRDLSRPELIDGFIESFRAAMKKRLPQECSHVFPLTGGRDSRLILYELVRLGAAPEVCVTFQSGPPGSFDPDVAAAAAVAEGLGLKHVVLHSGRPSLERSLRFHEETSFTKVGREWALELADYLGGKTELIYDGLAGDVLACENGFQTAEQYHWLRNGQVSQLCDKVLAPPGAFDRVFGQDARARLSYDTARELLAREVDRYKTTPNPLASFYFWTRTRRRITTIPFGLFFDVPIVHTPYLDHDVFDLMMSASGEHLLARGFRDEVISRLYPEHDHLAYAGGVPPASDSTRRYRKLFSDLLRFVFRERGSHLNRRSIIPRLVAGFVGVPRELSHHWYLGPLELFVGLGHWSAESGRTSPAS